MWCLICCHILPVQIRNATGLEQACNPIFPLFYLSLSLSNRITACHLIAMIMAALCLQQQFTYWTLTASQQIDSYMCARTHTSFPTWATVPFRWLCLICSCTTTLTQNYYIYVPQHILCYIRKNSQLGVLHNHKAIGALHFLHFDATIYVRCLVKDSPAKAHTISLNTGIVIYSIKVARLLYKMFFSVEKENSQKGCS